MTSILRVLIPLVAVTTALSPLSSVAQQSTTGPTPPPYMSIGFLQTTPTQVVIPGIPVYLWHHGCGPTALGMVVGYWDGHGYPDLIPGTSATQTADVDQAIASTGHYDDYALPLDTPPNLLPDRSELGGAHPSNSIADFMNTSWSARWNYYGWSWFVDVGSAFTGFVEGRNGELTASSANFPASWNDYRQSIDRREPVVLLVDINGDGATDHFVTGIGYDPVEMTYGIYNTWDDAVHWYPWQPLQVGQPWGIYGFTTFTITSPSPANILVNGSFESGREPWRYYHNGTGNSFAVVLTGGSPHGARMAKIVLGGTVGSNNQLYQSGVTLAPHARYRLRFQARSTNGHDLSVALHQHTAPYTDCGLGRRAIDLTPAWQTWGFDFVTSGFAGSMTNARLRFTFASNAAPEGEYFIDKVELIPLDPIPHQPAATWATTYGGFAWEDAAAVRQTSDGGYVIVGDTRSFGAGDFDAWVLKLRSDGSVEWQKRYGGSAWDQANAVCEAADGGYVVAGFTRSFGQGAQDGWVLKLRPNGAVEWQRTYGGTGDESFNALDLTPDGGILLAGVTASFGAGQRDGWVMKLHADGSPAWQTTLGGFTSEELFDIEATADGGGIIAGCTESFGAQLWDAWVVKLDPYGSVDWQKRYDAGWYECAYAAQQTADGGYIVSGRSTDAWILKLHPDGSIAWQRTYGGPNFDNYWDSHVRQTRDGGYIVAGHTFSFGAGDTDVWLFKLRADGAVAWQWTYGGSQWEGGSYVQETTDGGYVIAGVTHSFGPGPKDAWVLKLDSNGTCGRCPPARPTSASVGTPAGSAWSTQATPIPGSAAGGVTTVTGVATSAAPLQICPASENLVLNPGFENGTAPWRFHTDGTGEFANNAPGPSSARAARVTIATPGENVQLYQSELFLNPLSHYRLSFRARSSSGHDLSVVLQKHTAPFTNYGLGGWTVDLTTTWQQYTRQFQTSGFTSTVADGRLRFWFAPFDEAGDEFFIDDVELVWLGQAREAEHATAAPSFALGQNYPNPFNPTTTISYELASRSAVTLKVFDLLGREVVTLVDGVEEAGVKAVQWDASGVATGVYFYRLQAGDIVHTKRLILMK